MSRLKAACYMSSYLVVAFVFAFLMPDVGPYHVFVQPNRGDKVSSGPKHFSAKIPCSAHELPRNGDRALAEQGTSALHVPHYV